MPPATLHGVGVITKLYFAILAAFKESMSLNLAQLSLKVIDFGNNRKRVYIFLLMVNSNLDSILHRFRDTAACRKSTFLPTPLLFRLKFGGLPFGIDPCWGLQRAKRLGLSAVKLFSQNSNLYDHDSSTSQTDGQLSLAIP